MNKDLNLTKMNGTNVLADIICFLEDTTNNKRYVYYTLNETVGNETNSTVKIYVAKVKQNDASLDALITDEEWERLKGFMGEALKGTTNSAIKYIALSNLSDPTIVSEKVIAMPVSYDYINKHRAVYNAAVESDGAESGASIEPVSQPTVNVQDSSLPTEPELVQLDSTPVGAEQTTSVVEPESVVVDTPVEEPISTVEITPAANESSPENINLNAIDINEIEAKYAKMIEDINNLKAKEIEAANRYNATLELSAMHNEQHASYVASEQTKENTESVSIEAPVIEPPTIEPTPITPVTPEPVAATPAQDIETNWFDMPIPGTDQQ